MPKQSERLRTLKSKVSLTRTLATFQQPIGERRLSEVLKPLDPKQSSMLRDPERAFDDIFRKIFGWEALGKERYKLYREFLKCDGDLAYLIWLEGILTAGDNIVKSIREDLRAGARVAKSTKQLLDFINSPFMDYVGTLIVLRTAQSIEPSFLSDEWLEKTGDNIIHEACLQAFARYFYDSKPQKQKRAQKALRDSVLRFPLGELLWEYAVAPELTRREKKGGPPPDYWGTFFLMALSKHLSEGNKRPRYKLCYNLLNLFHDDHQIRTGSLTQTKIGKLQRLHPNWSQHLSSLRQTFLRLLASRT